MRGTESYFIFTSLHCYWKPCIANMTSMNEYWGHEYELSPWLKHNPFRSWFSVLLATTRSSRFRNSTGIWKYFSATPSSQELGAIGPGRAPQGCVLAGSSSGVASISQQLTVLLLVLMPFLLTVLTLLEILQRPQILPWTVDAPRIFCFMSTSWPPLSRFDLPSLAHQPLEGVSAGWRGFQGASRGLSILHPGLSVQRPWPVIQLHTHTHLHALV